MARMGETRPDRLVLQKTKVAVGTGSTGGGIGSGSGSRVGACVGLRPRVLPGLRGARIGFDDFFAGDGLAVRVLIFAFFTSVLPETLQ
jgi:hypothetical protein